MENLFKAVAGNWLQIKSTWIKANSFDFSVNIRKDYQLVDIFNDWKTSKVYFPIKVIHDDDNLYVMSLQGAVAEVIAVVSAEGEVCHGQIFKV